jgi:riboflavin biosynthesis pyrimidine reductase
VAAVRPAERAERPYVLLNMISSLDGRTVLGGGSDALGNPADRVLFHRLRTVADAVLVGSATARDEGYRRLVRDEEHAAAREGRGLEREPLLAVVTRSSADLPEAGRHERRVLLADPVEGLAKLRREHGCRTVLCEGGPTLNATMFAAGAIDELHLCLAAMLIGGEDPLTLLQGAPLDPPARPELTSVHEAGGYLFLRYRL